MFAKKGNDSMAARLIDLGNKKQTNFWLSNNEKKLIWMNDKWIIVFRFDL